MAASTRDCGERADRRHVPVRQRRQPPGHDRPRVGAEREPARARRERRDRALPEEHVDEADDDGPLDAQRERAERRGVGAARRRPRERAPRPRRARRFVAGDSAIVSSRPGRQIDDGRRSQPRRSPAATIASRGSGVETRYRIVPSSRSSPIALAPSTSATNGRISGRNSRSMSAARRVRVGRRGGLDRRATSAESSGASASSSERRRQQQPAQREPEERAVHLSGPGRARGR